MTWTAEPPHNLLGNHSFLNNPCDSAACTGAASTCRKWSAVQLWTPYWQFLPLQQWADQRQGHLETGWSRLTLLVRLLGLQHRGSGLSAQVPLQSPCSSQGQGVSRSHHLLQFWHHVHDLLPWWQLQRWGCLGRRRQILSPHGVPGVRKDQQWLSSPLSLVQNNYYSETWTLCKRLHVVETVWRWWWWQRWLWWWWWWWWCWWWWWLWWWWWWW